MRSFQCTQKKKERQGVLHWHVMSQRLCQRWIGNMVPFCSVMEGDGSYPGHIGVARPNQPVVGAWGVAGLVVPVWHPSILAKLDSRRQGLMPLPDTKIKLENADKPQIQRHL